MLDRNSASPPPNPHTTRDVVAVAKILTAHGVRGLVKLRVYLENAHDIEGFTNITDASGKNYKITLKNPIKTDWVAQIVGVDDRTAAESLRNLDLFIARDDLPALEDHVYYHDLIGRRVINTENEMIGEVADVNNFGAGDLLLIKPVTGKDFFVPYSPVCVISESQDHIIIDNYDAFRS